MAFTFSFSLPWGPHGASTAEQGVAGILHGPRDPGRVPGPTRAPPLPPLSPEPPRFIREPRDQIGVSGGVASFVCQATGDPKPRVTWNKKGKKVNSQRFEVSLVKGDSLGPVPPHPASVGTTQLSPRSHLGSQGHACLAGHPFRLEPFSHPQPASACSVRALPSRLALPPWCCVVSSRALPSLNRTSHTQTYVHHHSTQKGIHNSVLVHVKRRTHFCIQHAFSRLSHRLACACHAPTYTPCPCSCTYQALFHCPQCICRGHPHLVQTAATALPAVTPGPQPPPDLSSLPTADG